MFSACKGWIQNRSSRKQVVANVNNLTFHPDFTCQQFNMGGVWSTGAGSGQKKSGSHSNPEKIRGLTRLLTEENKRLHDVFRDEHDIHKDNMVLLKQLYKKMDPAIMKTATYSPHGDVELAFRYHKGNLLVLVIRARGLQAKDLRGKTSDPYVKLHIEPAEQYGGVMRTQTCQKSLNPRWHEIFTFPISLQELRTAKMVVQVLDSDLLDKDDMMGEAIVPLGFDFEMENENATHRGWYSLQEETDLHLTGELELTLSYVQPQFLRVKVHRASNLTNRHVTEDPENPAGPNPYVKMQIPGVQVVHETEKQYGTTNPSWEQSFDFLVPPHELSSRYLVLHAVDYDANGANDSLGQVVIELENFDMENDFHGTFELADLKNSDRLRSRWFQHATLMEFREALVSHAAFRHPKFLFQQHEGCKMISVTSRKARAQAKLKLMNGIPVY